MKLLWNSKFIPTCNRHFLRIRRIGVSQTFLDVKGLNFIRNFNFCSNSSFYISTELSCISNKKTMRRFDFNFELLSINFTHSFNFSERNCITIIKSMLFLFMKTYQSSFFLSNSSNMYRFTFFSSTINDSMFFSKVNKSEAIKSKIASVDESMIFLVDSFSKFDNIVTIVAIKYNYTFEISYSKSI